MDGYRDPGTDSDRCDALSDPPPAECIRCGNLLDDDTYAPFCDASCARQADGESDEDEPNPRERGDDDGVEYGDPRDERDERLNRD